MKKSKTLLLILALLAAQPAPLPALASTEAAPAPVVLRARVSTATFATSPAREPAPQVPATAQRKAAVANTNSPMARSTTAHRSPSTAALPSASRATPPARFKPASDGDIKAAIAMLQKYKQIRLSHSYDRSVSNARMQQAAIQQKEIQRPIAMTNQAANMARFVRMIPTQAPTAGGGTVLQDKAGASAAAAKKLPRWGDKDCLCHQGLRLFQQHRYLEAAAYYKKAGDNMHSAWGHDTWDEANARRGEAVSLTAAGRNAQAAALFQQAAAMYIGCAPAGRPAPELGGTLQDLGDALAHAGNTCRASAVRLNAGRLMALAKMNPPAAVRELNKMLR